MRIRAAGRKTDASTVSGQSGSGVGARPALLRGPGARLSLWGALRRRLPALLTFDLLYLAGRLDIGRRILHLIEPSLADLPLAFHIFFASCIVYTHENKDPRAYLGLPHPCSSGFLDTPSPMALPEAVCGLGSSPQVGVHIARKRCRVLYRLEPLLGKSAVLGYVSLDVQLCDLLRDYWQCHPGHACDLPLVLPLRE